MRKITRRSFIETSAKVSSAALIVGCPGVRPAASQTSTWYKDPQPEVLEQYLAVDNVCAYPSLSLLNDGTLVASIRNRPVHSGPDVDIDIWASEDGGRFWQKRGVAALHEPGTSQEQSASGIAHDGSLIVLARTDEYQGRVRKPRPLRVCRSSDGGRNWQRSLSVTPPDGANHLTPFGNIVRCAGNTLAVAVFHVKWRDEITRKISRVPDVMPIGEAAEAAGYLLFSKDDGRTWGDAAMIGMPGSRGRWFGSTTVLRLRPDRWLAAVDKWSHVALFVSKDEGRTWTEEGPLTVGGLRHRPGHLLRMVDGRILLTFGIRERQHFGHPPDDLPGFVEGTLFRKPLPQGAPITDEDLPPRKPYEEEEWYAQYGWGRGMSHGPGCLAMRWSEDEGWSWSAPRIVVHLEKCADGSYPATAQLKDGTLVSVYHADRMPQHDRFHMGVVRWKLDKKG
jgi:hypothetical protein